MTTIETLESAGNNVTGAARAEKSAVSAVASKVADTAREIPGKVVDAMRPAARFARDNVFWLGIAAGAIAAVGVTIYLLRRD
jgi:hypothetical protein